MNGVDERTDRTDRGDPLQDYVGDNAIKRSLSYIPASKIHLGISNRILYCSPPGQTS